MPKKFSNQEIFICGANRRFKRTQEETLRDAAKPLEDLQKDVRSRLEEHDELLEEAKELREDAEFEEDKETARKLIKKARKKEKDARKVKKAVEDEADELQAQMDAEQEKLCILLLDPFEPGDYANRDIGDKTKLKMLPMLYVMYMEGFSEAKIQTRIKQVINAEHEDQLSQASFQK